MEASTPKIGVFLWDQGGRISQTLEIKVLLRSLSKTKGVSKVTMVGDPFSQDALNLAVRALRDGELDRVVWVGRFTPEQKALLKKTLAEAGLNPFMQDWCDLEEQGVFDLAVGSNIRTKKAMVLIRMALARTRLLEPLFLEEIPGTESLLITGAGVAGLHAALAVVELGKKVYLVEKQSGVGGKVAFLHRFYPRLCDPRCGLEFALQSLRDSGRVEFHTLSEVLSLQGGPGNFQVRIGKAPRYVDEERCNGCGACSTVCPAEISLEDEGSMPFRDEISHKPRMKAIHPALPMPFPSAYVVERKHCHPGCQECQKVCPSGAVDLEQERRELELLVGAILVTTGWDPYPLAKVEELGLGLYPNVISNMEMETFVGYEKELPRKVGFVQCAGSRDQRHLPYCSAVCCSVTLKQVLELKQRNPDARCYVLYQDIRCAGFQEELYQKVKEQEGVIFIRCIPSTITPETEKGKLKLRLEDTLSGREVNLTLDLLVLAGGMVPSRGTENLAQVLGLPRNQFGFFESHMQCHPEESQRTGIYVAGCCREPMNVGASIDSAKQAALEALKFLKGTLLIEPTYPVVDKTKCDKCKRCMEECPFTSFYFDENGFPTPHFGRCRHCGNCVGICPLGAISLKNLTIKQMAAQIHEASKSFMDTHDPLILSFLCENDAYHAARSAMEEGHVVPPNVVFVKVPCAGYVNNAVVADALALGIDGIFIGGCHEGQCHYLNGPQLVKKRSDDLSDKLQKMMIERDRVRFLPLGIRDSTKYCEAVQAFLEDLKAMGPSPFKI